MKSPGPAYGTGNSVRKKTQKKKGDFKPEEAPAIRKEGKKKAGKITV